MQQQKNKKQNRNLFGGKIDVIFELFFPYTLLPHTQRERERERCDNVSRSSHGRSRCIRNIFEKCIIFFFLFYFFWRGSLFFAQIFFWGQHGRMCVCLKFSFFSLRHFFLFSFWRNIKLTSLFHWCWQHSFKGIRKGKGGGVEIQLVTSEEKEKQRKKGIRNNIRTWTEM